MANEHNPFAGGDDPFNDPSVKNASAYGAGDAYNNPFEGGINPGAPLPKASAYEAPKPKKSVSTSAPTELKPTAFKGASSPRQSSAGVLEDDLAMREQAIARRETQIQEREKELEAREKKLGPWAKYKPPNWPCECYPITYHNIAEEIPEQHQALIRKFYAAVLWEWVCIIWNWLVLLIIWASDDDASNGASNALWSSIFLIGIPGSWKVWYRPVYNGVGTNKSGTWVMFFIFYFAHMVFAGIMALGVPSCAASGLFMMIKMFGNSHNVPGILCLVTVAVWTISFLASLYLMKKAHSTWKRMGGEEELQKEMAKRSAQGSMAVTVLNNVPLSDAGEV